MFSFWYILTNNFFEDHSLAEIMAKPKQKYELNFQNDISDQLEQMTKQQLLRLFFTIIKIIPISFALLSEYCHTRLHLGFSAQLRILQVSACKMEPGLAL